MQGCAEGCDYECAVIPVLLVVAFSQQGHLPSVIKAKQVWKFICGSGLPGREAGEGMKVFAGENNFNYLKNTENLKENDFIMGDNARD